jgi:hypothetical protein
MVLSASLLLPDVALKDRPSVEGIVLSEYKAISMVLFMSQMGVSPMHPMGGGELVVFGDGVMLLLPVRRAHSCLHKK